jgi:hypothetical protein
VHRQPKGLIVLSRHYEAAVDHQDLPGDKAPGTGRQKKRRAHRLARFGRFQSGPARCTSVRNGPGEKALTRMPY